MTEENEKMMIEKKRITEKIDFYLDEKIQVHIKLKDKSFLNGLFLKKSKENVYWLRERKLGEIFVFVGDVHEVREFQEVGG